MVGSAEHAEGKVLLNFTYEQYNFSPEEAQRIGVQLIKEAAKAEEYEE